MTEWHPVGFGWSELYEVSRRGDVRRVGSTKLIGTTMKNGYRRAQFSRDGIVEGYLIHKLVADAFIGRRPIGNHIDHINGIRDDNRVENLRYCTPTENVSFARDRGSLAFGERNGVAVLTNEQVAIIREMKATGGRYWGAAKIAVQLGVGESTVRQAARGFRYACVPAAAIRAGRGEA